MSQYPQQPVSAVIVTQQPVPSNGLGITGFILSLVGLVSCGILSPLALIFSLIGLRKQPKGLAIAGTVISLVSLIPLFIAGGTIFATVLGFLGLASAVAKDTEVRTANFNAAKSAVALIESSRASTGSLPDDSTGTSMIVGSVDFWKTPLEYHKSGLSYFLLSAGPDKKTGTADDIQISAEQVMSTQNSGATMPSSMSNTSSPSNSPSR